MGKIRELLGKAGDRAFGTPQERQERRDREDRARRKEKAIEDTAYYAERKRQAKKRGIRKARQPTGIQRIGMFADNVSKAAGDYTFNDPFAPRKKPPARRAKPKKRRATAPKRDKFWWED